MNSCSMQFRTGATPGVRHLSGQVVFDEMFQNGRLVSRYWNTNGQIWPDMHFGSLKWNSDQPADTFHLAVDGRELAGGYTWESAGLEPDPSAWRTAGPVTHGVVSLLHEAAGIRVRVHTRLDGSAFLIRWLEITNLSGKPTGITAVAPFAGLLWHHRYEEHLAPPAETPFDVVYNHRFEWGQEGDFWPEPLPAGRKVVDGGKKGRSGWGRPAFWARNACNGQTVVCELAWGGNYQFELDCRTSDDFTWGGQPMPHQRNAALFFRMGLSSPEAVLRVLDAGETLQTPAVHLGLFTADTDTVVQATHQHVRHTVMPAQIPGRHVEIEANHRGYLCDRENVPDIIKDVEVAASLGTELYVIDAGWYGNEPNQWWNNVGDWFEGKWMAGGMQRIVDRAHTLGMKFGLWVEIEAIGANSKLRQQHPEWLLTSHDKPIADSRALDLTHPEVQTFVEGEITRFIGDYGLDMYRIDHNHCLTPAPTRSYQGYTEDLIWRYYDALYAIFDRLRTRFPAVVFQNCAGGGGRLDWGTMARFHNVELSDWMRLPRGFKILNGVSFSLPPEILMRAFGTEAGQQVLDGDVDAQLRHNFCRIILRGTAPSVEELTPYLRQRVEHYLARYREVIRPILTTDARVFHHTPFLSVADHAPWCVLEYAASDRSRSVAVLLRASNAPGNEFVFKPRGLDPARDYDVTFDNQETTVRFSGRQLTQKGVTVCLERPLSSEMLLIKAVQP